ncbi:hypothetical protein HIM_02485 [Hirsutella minnesotensis 3608]|nr:hypothetical protein HIM_02485 [Hirsutella minnesotensis 3608]
MASSYDQDVRARRPRVRFAGRPDEQPQRLDRFNGPDVGGRRRPGPEDDYYRRRRPAQVQVHGRPWDRQGDRTAVYREVIRPAPPYGMRMASTARRVEPQHHRRDEGVPITYTETISAMAPAPRMAEVQTIRREEVTPRVYTDVEPAMLPEQHEQPSPPPPVQSIPAEVPEGRLKTSELGFADPFASPPSPERPVASEEPTEPQRPYGWSGYPSVTSLRPPSPIGDDVDILDGFDFVFPHAEPSKQRDLADLLEAAGAESESSPRDDVASIKPSNATSVFSSAYTGDAELGGVQSASITVLHDSKGRKRPLFRWLHIKQDMMNFDEFWAEIPRQVRLSEAEVTATAKLRADVKRHSLKSRQNPKGFYVGYMDPRHFQVPLKDSNAKRAPQDGPGAAARWICLPYFALQEYSGLLSASSLASFPPLTLLQSHYSRTPEQRDMQQAVCQLKAAPRGECFHIAQLWCLVLDNTLLVTCGTMSQSDLYGDSLRLISQPSMAQSETCTNGRILVSYGSAVTWIFSVQECPTWFSFASRFTAFWPKRLEFTWRDQVVSPSNWPKILKYASRPQGSLALKLRAMPRPEPQEPILKPEAPGEATSQGPANQAEHIPGFLHVLMLHPADLPQNADTDSEYATKGLIQQLQAAEDFILGRTSFAQQRAYKSCGGASRLQVYHYLAKLEAQVEDKASDFVRRSYEERIEIFNAAEDLFTLFFPKDFDGPTTSQYWGSVKAIVHMASLDDDDEDDEKPGVHPEIVRELRTYLQPMSEDVQAFQRLVGYASQEERADMELPRQFVTAWLHAVSGMIATTLSVGQDNWAAYMGRSRALIEDGMQSFIQDLSDRSLVEDLAVLPMDVMSLIALDLVQDQVGKSDDIVDTYSNYLSSLDTDITTKPSDRSYQHSVELVQQEMTAIKRTLARQRFVLGSIRASLLGAAGTDYVLDAGEDFPGQRRGRRDTTPAWLYAPPYREAAQAITYRSSYTPAARGGGEYREFEFRRHTEYAEDLERAVAFKMDWTKDRQENAIYAFTIVTIVFLPISAISSVFGMNTSDVRNMAYGQWLYWAVALPVTLVVIVVGLWWMNELPPPPIRPLRRSRWTWKRRRRR